MTTCKIESCEREVYNLGMCRRHYESDYEKRNPEQRQKRLERNRKWRAANPDRMKVYKQRRQEKIDTDPEYWKRDTIRRHGISFDFYESVIAEQEGLCPICRVDLVKAVIDHDHSHCPGPYGCKECFRGIICSDCNSGLGHFKDDAAALMRAASYLASP